MRVSPAASVVCSQVPLCFDLDHPDITSTLDSASAARCPSPPADMVNLRMPFKRQSTSDAVAEVVSTLPETGSLASVDDAKSPVEEKADAFEAGEEPVEESAPWGETPPEDLDENGKERAIGVRLPRLFVIRVSHIR